MEDNTTKVFNVKCNTCTKTRPFLKTEDQIKDIVSKPHKDQNGKDCDGKLSYDDVEIQYIMKTCWDRHWDNLHNGETYYTRKAIKIGIPIEKIPDNIKSAEVIFLKRRDKESIRAEKAWKGRVEGFNIREGTTSEGEKYPQLWFNVHIEGEINIPEEYDDFMYGDELIKTRSKIDKGQTDIFTSWGT